MVFCEDLKFYEFFHFEKIYRIFIVVYRNFIGIYRNLIKKNSKMNPHQVVELLKNERNVYLEYR